MIIQNNNLKKQKWSEVVLCKQRCSQKCLKFHRETPVLESLFNKVSGPGLQLYQKRLQRQCFPVKFEKFFRAPICERPASKFNFHATANDFLLGEPSQIKFRHTIQSWLSIRCHIAFAYIRISIMSI